MNLEAAYHDCKIVFDGITDNNSFQKADAGLVLHYANEIIYALREASQGKDTDVISRQAALDVLDAYQVMVENGEENPYAWARGRMCELPSAQLRYEELTPEEAASKIASGSLASANNWCNIMIQIQRMGYAICRKK